MNPYFASKSDFTYYFHIIREKRFLIIIDGNLGRMSVTNNIENIVAWVFKANHIAKEDQNDLYIIYCDSDGMWDGFNWKTQEFVPLQKKFPVTAGILYLQKEQLKLL